MLDPSGNLKYSSDHYPDYLFLATLVWYSLVVGHTELLLVGMCVH